MEHPNLESANGVQTENGQAMEWLFSDGSNIHGPLKESELLAKGLTPDMLVWSRYLPSWSYAREVPVLSYLFSDTVRDEKIGNYHPTIPTRMDDDDSELTSDIGNPLIMPIIGLLAFVATLAYFFYTNPGFGDRLFDDGDTALVVFFIFSLQILCLVISFITALGALSIASVDGATANRKSGAATAWGWAELLACVYLLMFLSLG